MSSLLERQTSFTQAARQTAATLLVADSTCPQIRELLSAADAPVLWLDGKEPPLQAVSRALAERRQLGRPVDTLHWVNHGSPGRLHLGATAINSATLVANAHNLASWGITNLALWSCQAGADHRFIALWEELTGASVWSSSGVLGRLEDGSSDWALASGSTTEAPELPVAAAQLQLWSGQLNGGNSAPVASGSPSLAAISEDAPTPAGDTVANLFGSSYTDADSNTFVGIAITANAATSSQGVWQYSTDNGSNWAAVPTIGLAETSAFYVAARSKLRFLPAADFNGTPGALTARLIDSTYNGAAESSSDYFLQFIETASEVKATLTLDPTAFDDNSAWSQSDTFPTFATVVGLADAGIGGTVGTVESPFSNQVDSSSVTLSAKIPLTGAQSTAPNLIFGAYSLADSATGDLFGLWSANDDTNAIIAYDQDMYNSLVNTTNPVVSTATWNNTTLLELGVSEGTGTFSTTSGSLSFNGAYTVDIFGTGDSINVSSNGGTTAISAATLSLSTSVTAVNDAPAGADKTISPSTVEPEPVVITPTPTPKPAYLPVIVNNSSEEAASSEAGETFTSISAAAIADAIGTDEAYEFNEDVFAAINVEGLADNYNVPIEVSEGLESETPSRIVFNLQQARQVLDTTEATAGGGTVASNAPSDVDLVINGVYFNSSAGNDDLTGSTFSDFIRAGAGDDIINGGSGNDLIRGGSGSDQITLGEGADIVYYTIDQLDGSTDTITDLTAEDQIRLGEGIQLRSQSSTQLVLEAILPGETREVTVNLLGLDSSPGFTPIVI